MNKFCKIKNLVERFDKKCIYLTPNLRYFSATTKKENYEAKDNSYIHCSTKELQSCIKDDIILIPNFVSETEELNLLKEIEPRWRRLKYQNAHWDNAIHGYRETQMSQWCPENQSILDKIKKLCFEEQDNVKNQTHILDLSEDGFIKPHVDAVKFCGRVIAGISLLSSSVMCLINESDKNEVVNVLLEQRSLYVLKNSLRFDFTHEILKTEESYFAGIHVPKGRRISVIRRSESLLPKTDNLFKSTVVSLDS